jgi:hypothetical protein
MYGIGSIGQHNEVNDRDNNRWMHFLIKSGLGFRNGFWIDV